MHLKLFGNFQPLKTPDEAVSNNSQLAYNYPQDLNGSDRWTTRETSLDSKLSIARQPHRKLVHNIVCHHCVIL